MNTLLDYIKLLLGVFWDKEEIIRSLSYAIYYLQYLKKVTLNFMTKKYTNTDVYMKINNLINAPTGRVKKYNRSLFVNLGITWNF